MEAIFWMIRVLYHWIIAEHNGNYRLFQYDNDSWEDDGWFVYYGKYDHIDDVIAEIVSIAEKNMGAYGIINTDAVFSLMKIAPDYEISELEDDCPNILRDLYKEVEAEMVANEPDSAFTCEADMFVQHKLERGQAWYRNNKRTYYPKKH